MKNGGLDYAATFGVLQVRLSQAALQCIRQRTGRRCFNAEGEPEGVANWLAAPLHDMSDQACVYEGPLSNG